jgi:hypothetical protein
MTRSIPELQNPFLSLRAGCYRIHFIPCRPYHSRDDNPDDIERNIREYAGTLRVVHYDAASAQQGRIQIADPRTGTASDLIRLSGDLYAITDVDSPPSREIIPIFPIADYRFHLMGKRITELDHGEFKVELASTELRNGSWLEPTTVSLCLHRSKTSSDSPSDSDALEGTVLDTHGELIGDVKMTWISRYLRRAVLEFDTVEGIQPPRDSQVEVSLDTHSQTARGLCTWETVFNPCGWELSLPAGDQPAEPATKVWAEHELQEAIPALRDSENNDEEWRYHVLCVGELEEGGRGFMFDVRGTQSGGRFVECAVLAAKYRFNGGWAQYEGKELAQTPLYFRTAVHEVGHSMKLEHNFSTHGFMAPTDSVRLATLENANGNGSDLLAAIEWQFAPDDQERLRHWPDAVVRPAGGAAFLPLQGLDDSTPARPPQFETTSKDLDLAVIPLRRELPLGAPVRMDLILTNRGTTDFLVPELRIKQGNLSGRVLHHDLRKTFQPVSRLIDDQLRTLAPGKSIRGSLSLLRGPEGALFPEPGPYSIIVELDWFNGKRQIHLEQTAQISMLPVIDSKHARVAQRLRDTKDTLASFAIGGDGFAEGNQAINVALTNPVLSPHFAIIRLRRLIRDYGTIPGCMERAIEILGDTSADKVILCASELLRLGTLISLVEKRRPGMTIPEKIRLAFRIIFGRPNDRALEILTRTPSSSVRSRTAAAQSSCRKAWAALGLTLLTAECPVETLLAKNASLVPFRKAAVPARKATRVSRNGRAESSSPSGEWREDVVAAGVPLEAVRNVVRRFESADPEDSLFLRAGPELTACFQRNAPTATDLVSMEVHDALLANLIANLIIAGVPRMEIALNTALASASATNVLGWILQSVIPGIVSDLPDNFNATSQSAQKYLTHRLNQYGKEMLKNRSTRFLECLRADPLNPAERQMIERVIADSAAQQEYATISEAAEAR